jgi:hypothetical protein
MLPWRVTFLVLTYIPIHESLSFGAKQGKLFPLAGTATASAKPALTRSFFAYDYNSGRLNNQLHSIAHHFVLAKAIGRTLLIPQLKRMQTDWIGLAENDSKYPAVWDMQRLHSHFDFVLEHRLHPALRTTVQNRSNSNCMLTFEHLKEGRQRFLGTVKSKDSCLVLWWEKANWRIIGTLGTEDAHQIAAVTNPLAFWDALRPAAYIRDMADAFSEALKGTGEGSEAAIGLANGADEASNGLFLGVHSRIFGGYESMNDPTNNTLHTLTLVDCRYALSAAQV